ncbi:TraB/GumN family protein [Undibacterium jejuense]|uniref:TraB/GumN family protein n=1 Tax=Undibacterium jejuense TaxID=1344949 RepID=A0A923KR06_9BURK|nr:TraB/GumN family protein [Undibacterium jejuense]MBC3863456.1 TraB/GumN family protein [Undibacterium jejuense]
MKKFLTYLKNISIIALFFWFEIFLAILCTIFFSSKASAQQIYEVNKDGKTAFLIASSHAPNHGVYNLPQWLLDKVKTSRDLCIESKSPTPDEAYLEYKSMASQSRKKYTISEKKYRNKAIDLIANNVQLDVGKKNDFYQFSSYYLADTLLTVHDFGLPLAIGKSIDQMLFDKFSESNLNSDCYLESYSSALNQGQNISSFDAYVYLKYAINLIDKPVMQKEYVDYLTQIQVAYSQGRIEKICDIENQYNNKNGLKNIELITIISRNKNFAAKISDFMTIYKKPTIAIGALHFCGPGSVLNILKRNGFSIREFNF